MHPRVRTLLPAFAAAGLLAATAAAIFLLRGDGTNRGAARGSIGAIRWTDVTAAAGISFRHESGARGEMLNPETFGPGAGWLDHDGDGRQDLLLVNSNLLRGDPDPSAVPVLYRNLGDGRFEDVTARAGLAVPFYGMGFASADVDNDGDQDVLLYGLHRSFFFLNQGGGRFLDATGASGLAALTGWVCAAAFLDYDRDGKLDLFVGNYVIWTPESEKGLDCNFGTPRKKYCAVAAFAPSAPQLFHGKGDGTFEERTREAGLAGLKGKCLGVAVEDYDRDGFPDIFAANDSVPNFLLHNRRDGTFEDRGIESGFATDADGAALAGMGIDTAWKPDGGPLIVAVGNFSGEPTTLHQQEAVDYFVDRSMSLGIARRTFDRVTFGLLLYDQDLDGNLDLLTVNGHVFDVAEITGIPYRQRAQLFLGQSDAAYEEVQPSDQEHFLNRAILGRSAALADFDGDGDLDLAVTENQGPAILLRNDLPRPAHFVRLALRGTVSNRDGLGAEVTLQVRGPSGVRSVRRTLKSASSYLSQSERFLTFGLGAGGSRADAEVLWPSGRREVFAGLPADRESLLIEGKGGEAAAPAGAPMAGAGGSPLAARKLGVEHYGAGRVEEALRAFEEATRLDPQDFVAHRFALMCLYQAGRKTEARARAGDIARRFPDAHFLVSHFALVLRESSLPEPAELMFREAAALDPRRADVWIALGNLAFDRKDLDEALRCYQEVLGRSPDSIEALANSGKVHTIRKDYSRAKPLLERAVALRPDYPTALSTLGGVMIEEGRFDQAESYLMRALASTSSRETQVTIHGNLGILFFKLRDRRRAIDSFEKVLQLDPSDQQARQALERLRR